MATRTTTRSTGRTATKTGGTRSTAKSTSGTRSRAAAKPTSRSTTTRAKAPTRAVAGTRGRKTPDDVLRDLAEGKGDVIGDLLELQIQNIENSGLDAKTHAMVRLAALVTEDASPASYAFQLPIAAESGVTRNDVAGMLVALAPTVGAARVVQGAEKIARGLAIDFAAAKSSKQTAGKMK